MITPYFGTIEMSCFRNAKIPFSMEGHDGRKEHCHDTSEGIAKVEKLTMLLPLP
jgi:hypothetical protein